MALETKPDLRLEIAHVLFIDIVGYSRLLINEQREALEELNQIVRGTEAFRAAEAAGKLTRLPTGDGMALVFSNTPEAPVECALQISRALRGRPELRVRMGIHSGPVSGITDVNDRSNVAGAGINIAQRVMDCGDAGHILLSKRLAEDLAQYRHWQPHLHDLGECQVKHDLKLSVVNLYTDEAGNSVLPEKFAARQRDKFAPEPSVKAPGRRRKMWWIGLLGLAAVLLFLATWFFANRNLSKTVGPATPGPVSSGSSTPNPVPPIDAKSVAILPFENLSSDKENAFFAQGIQDEIITALSKISGLRVISRTSTARYNSNPENLPEIARELHVAKILEGSVQRIGDRAHINVQLIQADNDTHLWAQSYDRELTDIFAVEAEVAKRIADSLSTTLSPQEKARVETKPTDNADAYVLYLRARDYQTRPDTLLQDFQAATKLYEQAIALDPNFALAHARLSATTSNIYHWFQPTEALKQKARNEAREALRLQPNLGEGHAALGVYFYYEELDYAAALRELDIAAGLLPNDGDVGLYIAAVHRRQGHWQDAIAAYRHAEAIDPRNPVMLYDASQTYFGLRDWPRAIEGLDRVLALSPDSYNVKIQRAYMEFFWKGSTSPITTALDTVPASFDPDGVMTFARWDVALMNRDPDTAAKAVASCRSETVNAPTGFPLPKSYLQGCIDLVRGDNARAQTEFESARPAIEATVANSPQDGPRRAQLGLLYAFMGRKDDAIREGRHALELKPISVDVIDGAVVECYLALIYARTGQTGEAISRVERLLSTPFAVDYCEESITHSDLRVRWEWDPLRKDPRFQKILTAPEPKTVY
ncbi:MAG TPA: tetratricopeptide repeat protein [Chthoniobacterales bacterium]|jgi:serine/threonine-protein kinase